MSNNLARRAPGWSFCLVALATTALAAPPSLEAGKGGDAAGKAALSGAVKGSTLATAVGLKKIGEALHKLKRAATELVTECERQDLVVVAEPDVIGPMILPAIPAPDGLLNAGDVLPPRKKYLELYGVVMQKLIPILAEEVNDTIIPSDKQQSVAAQWAEIAALVEDIRSHYEKLVPLIQVDEKNIDRLAVGKEALAIHDDCRKVETLRKAVFQATRR